MITNENLKWLSMKQADLDNDILDKHHLANNDEIFKKKLVAFMVELGEYANEKRSFKFWSNKPASDLSIQLEEYVDGMHFIISLGNYIDYDFNDFKFEARKISEVDNYLVIISNLANFSKTNSKENYVALLNSFLNIMSINKYSEQAVLEAYKKKNQINYNRQENNY